MKQAVFYCESCNRPVPLDAETCPHCGSRFTAVQCPQCSFVGQATQFQTGCPQCGYLASEVKRTRGRVPSVQGGVEAAAKRPRPQPPQAKAERKPPNRLPPWFYSLASLLLLLVLAGLVLLLLRRP